jgi:type I site-specific restriction endonuclease
VTTHEAQARQHIDALLAAAGWAVQDFKAANLQAARGVALREFELNSGYGTADYLLYVDGKAAGIIEAKKQGATLTGVEAQSARYTQGLPATRPAWRRPLPFVYESTGLETHFTNSLDPEPRARNVFAFHRPETLAEWLAELPQATVLSTADPRTGAANAAHFAPATFLARVRAMPPLVTEWSDFKLWPAQITAIRNLEASLAQKITYRTTGTKPEELIKAFRTSYYPRIAVTVDMIATGTDIKPVEIVVFMRSVKSRSFFEQMKGRGVRVIKDADLRSVNPGEHVHKDRFVIVDCVGVCERDKTDSRPMDQKKSVPLDALLQAVSLGNVEPEVLSSVAVRLARVDAQLTDAERAKVMTTAGIGLKELSRQIVTALNPPREESGERAGEGVIPAQAGIQRLWTYEDAAREATKPLSNPALRTLILTLKASKELVIDTVTQDRVLEAGFSEAARERAQGIVQSFEAFIAQHRDEITALQILYNRPTKAPLRFEDLKALADTLQAPPHLWTESQLWQAYAALDQSKVKGASRRRILTDLVSLVRYAMHQENELVPYPERVAANFKAWMAQQQAAGKAFTDEQRWWLEKMAEHIASNLGIEPEDFGYAPFDQRGGLGKVHQLFGANLPKVIDELNRELVA